MTSPAGYAPIAVIGMAGRFPGAGDLDQFWDNLRRGVESVRSLSEQELLAAGVDAATLADHDYVRAVAAAPELEGFDAALFGFPARDARLCDPQLRLLLECCHAALDDAGCDVARRGDVGVFAGAGPARYLDLIREADGELARAAAPWNSADNLAALVSRTLGLRGPSVGVLAGNASSLVAVHLAASALQGGECAMALAGGAEVVLPLDRGYRWEPDGVRSRDGHCRPFDALATGTVFGSGGGVVVLKRLADAMADGDPIRAVIRASAVNHDGAAGQDGAGKSAVAATALARAGAIPADLSMLEAHAIGTRYGDVAEVAALSTAYRDRGSGWCALTSVKGNIGHLGHAAGVASLIKVVLSLEHETIPGNIGYRVANPALTLDGSPFHLPTGPLSWPTTGAPRLAAVNSFAAEGTNAHVIVAESPTTSPVPGPPRPHALVWSAADAKAADAYRERLVTHLGERPNSFTNTVATLQHGRFAHRHRGAVVAADPQEAAALLRDPGAAGHVGTRAGDPTGAVAFLFPGAPGDYASVCADLYEWSTGFAWAFDECLDLFDAGGLALRAAWRAAGPETLDQVECAHPLVFATEYALTAMWRGFGVSPDVVLGHGVGELAAATVAGVLTLPDAVGAVIARSRAIAATPRGAMLAVVGSPEQVAPLLVEGSSVAVRNGPRQLVVAGPAQALAQVATNAAKAGLSSRPVRGSHPLHSPGVADAVPVFARALREVTFAAPVVELYSSGVGGAAGEQAPGAGFFADQLAAPVRFADAVDALLAGERSLLLVEAGPGRALTTVLRQHSAVVAGRHRVVATLPLRRNDNQAEIRSALLAAATAWVDGQPVDWQAVEDLGGVARISVPGYPYQRTRHWVGDQPPPRPEQAPVPQGQASTLERMRALWVAQLGRADIPDDGDFFDLGGNSLNGVELMARVRAEFGVGDDIDMITLFDHPTLTELADQIDQWET